jgi:ATP/maltotriose-dependent transcriptional regulator MalT
MPRTMPRPAKGPGRFSPPRAPQTPVERARLIERIEASNAPLTLICAPAGFGKTTLMQQLRQRSQARDIATVWLRLDRADNELGRFLHSVIGATHVAVPNSFQPISPNLSSAPARKGSRPICSTEFHCRTLRSPCFSTIWNS